MENGASLPLIHIDILSRALNIYLLNVLVVLYLTKSIILISKLTFNFSLSITLTINLFNIPNRQTKKVVATGKKDGGLFVLKRENTIFIFFLFTCFL